MAEFSTKLHKVVPSLLTVRLSLHWK